MNKVDKVHKDMLSTKHQSCNPRKRILKLVFFVPMFQLVTPRAGPVLTP